MTAKERALHYKDKHGARAGIVICNEILLELEKQFQGFGSADRVNYWMLVKLYLADYI